MPLLRNLRWLPVVQRVIFKTAVLVWKCIHGVVPVYLQELCTQVNSIRGRPRLRSTGGIQLPRVQTSVAQRSFASYNGPAVWNSLPATLRDSSVSLYTRIQAATENVLICSTMNTARRCMLRLFLRVWRRYVRLLTYLLTYFLIYLLKCTPASLWNFVRNSELSRFLPLH